MNITLKTVLAGIFASACAHAAHATVYVNQTWDTGTGPDLGGYYISSGTATSTTVSDSVINSGNANQIAVSTGGGIRIMCKTMSTAATLTNVGDTLTYSMSFHFTTAFTSTGTYTPTFRLGLYNSNATPVTTGWSGGSTQSNDDYGYSVALGMNSATVVVDADYKGVSISPMDFAALDTVLANSTSASFSGVNNTSAHNVSLVLTNAATGVSIAVVLDGQTIYTGVDSSSKAVTSFDSIEFGVFNNWADAYTINVDNIHLETASAPVPEPAAIGLLGLGTAALLLRKK